ncbi:MAG TPA: Ig-like domain-containing protein, partial [Terriglobales bacterium]|nr:Ig-like domain-containing protein [Terriglobales bacterium]
SGLGNGTTSVDLSGLTDGPITAAISATDTAGNHADGSGDSSTKDTTADAAPTAAVVINDGDGYINNTEKAAVSYTVSGIDSDATATVIFSDGNPAHNVVVSGLGNGSTTVNLSGLTDGTVTASISVSDIAGNSATGTGDSSVKDTTADAVPTAAVVINDGDGYINNTEKTAVSYTVSGIDSDATATVTFSDGNPAHNVVVSGLGNGSTTVNLSGLTDGTVTASISVSDIAGNSATGTGDTSVKDTTAPIISIGSITGDNIISSSEAAAGFAIGGTTTGAESTQTVTVKIVNSSNTVVDTYTTAAGGGTWSVNVTKAQAQALADGSYTVKADVADIAGNSAIEATQSLKVDETSPFAQTPAQVSVTNNDRTVVLTFNEKLTAGTFTAADLTASSGTITSVATSDNQTFTITIQNVTGNTKTLTVLAGGYTDLDGNTGLASNSIDIKTAGTIAFPAGVAGSPINLALLAPQLASSNPITVKVSGVPSDWTLNQGTNLGGGIWIIQQADLASLEVTTASTFAGAVVLNIEESWTNSDGSSGVHLVDDNVEAYGAGSPIYAWSGDDTLTGSAGKDSFVFANPIGNDVIQHFDVGMDQVDLVGFGIADFTALQGHIANDANGNAVITLGDGETITIDGVDAGQLTAGNFAFDQEPVMHNGGTLAISDGAFMPVSGVIDNTGVIQLNSTGNETDLEIIQHGATLQGGGQVVLSDDSHNTIYGSTADTLLHNVDNTISGAGNIGGGSLTLVNDGSIVADGTHALTIDTGTNHITNTGTLEATGSGGLVIDSPLDNSGTLWANGGNVTVNGDVSGSGHAQVSGTAMLDFGGSTQQDINLDSDAVGTLKLDHAESYKGTVSGLDANDVLDLGDVAFGSNTNVSYAANEAGNGGVLSVTDGVHTAQIGLSGQYAAAGFQAGGDHDLGTTITFHPELVTA